LIGGGNEPNKSLAFQDIVEPGPQFSRQILACGDHLREALVAVEAHDHAGEAVFRYARVRVLQDRPLDGRVAAFEQAVGDRLVELLSSRDLRQDAVLDALPVCDLDEGFVRQCFRSRRKTAVRQSCETSDSVVSSSASNV
jgi:hypothetical protein